MPRRFITLIVASAAALMSWSGVSLEERLPAAHDLANNGRDFMEQVSICARIASLCSAHQKFQTIIIGDVFCRIHRVQWQHRRL